MSRWVLRLLVLAGLGFVAWKLWQRRQQEADQDHGWEWANEPGRRADLTASPVATRGTTAAPGRTGAGTTGSSQATGGDATGAGGATGRPGANGGAEAGAGAPGPGVGTIWVKPVGSTCPTGYPVKAKTGSRVFRVPGMFSYEESKPDRCYCDEEAATADGFSRAKR